jgi:hypothetical protein
VGPLALCTQFSRQNQIGGLLVTVLVVALNHQIQRAEVLSGGDEIEKLERQQKENFATYVACIIEERNLGFVGEEAQHGVPLIAEKVATDLNCCHANVDMSPDVRQRRAIPNDYSRQDRPYTAEQRTAWHREREGYMFDQVLQNAACERAAVLCGREHLEALAKRFQDSGHEVETYDLNREDWYIEDWLMHVIAS